MRKISLLAATSFLAAFLLFQIELIISKIFLPKYGGTFIVWGACLVFFQFALLFGYIYAHGVVQYFGFKRYRPAHIILMLLPLFFFPGRPLPEIIPQQSWSIVFDIFVQLAASIGLVFFVLSTISIIIQAWVAASELPERSNPYIIYAFSNLGSFLAILSYPFLFEAFFDINAQIILWRIGYVLFIIFYLFSFYAVKAVRIEKDSAGRKFDFLRDRIIFAEHIDLIQWFLFSAATSISFISVTNIITYEITPGPLFWVIPLCVYLASFVLVFRNRPLYPKWLERKWHIIIALSVVLFLLSQRHTFPVIILTFLFLASLWAICMFCHYELYRIRPSSNQGLTKFYLAISSGGMLGGMFVTWVAPLLFSSTYEFIVGIILALIAFALNHKFEKLPQRQIRFIIYLLLLVICWPFVFKQGYNVFGVTLLALTYGWIFSCLKKKPWSMVVGVACLFCALFFVQKQWGANIVGFRMRNYYGIYRISGLNNAIYFSHGNTMHGVQYIDEKRKNEPLAYFNPGSPVGKLLTSDQFAFRNMGFIGLGAGTLAAYGKPGQEIDFYEIDRDVFLIADNFFTYLKNSKAKLSYIFGDARITLKKAKADSYDLLVIDAFSGDSIPIHLITVEAINEYRKVLKDKGVILFHITNNFLDLAPVLYGNSEKTGSRVLLQYQDPTQEEQINKLYIFSYWVAMTWDNDSYERLKNKLAWMPVENTRVRKVRAWTDSYSNILSVLKIGHMLESLRFFTPFSW